MLVLARKEEESILIGDDIEIKIVSIDKGVVKIGIEAPKDLAIIRSELLQNIKNINIKASQNSLDNDIKDLSDFIKKQTSK